MYVCGKKYLAGTLLVALLAVTPAVAAEKAPLEAKLLGVQRIWDRAPHNAFTGMARFQDHLYCTFREAACHVDFGGGDGKIRVLASSPDGREWASAALLTPATLGLDPVKLNLSDDKIDLRDPKITVTPNGELMVVLFYLAHKKDGFLLTAGTTETWTSGSIATFSKDGRNWSQGIPIGEPGFVLWRVVWHEGTCYAAAIGSPPNPDILRLYRSTDGRKFEVIAENILPEWSRHSPGSAESALVFLDDGACYCAVRRAKTGLLGRAEPPYTEWTWKGLDKIMSSPDMVRLPDNTVLAAVRRRDRSQGRFWTSLLRVDWENGEAPELFELPSDGDCAYPGIVYHDGLVWICYYSSHEGKSNIYLAKVKVEPAKVEPAENQPLAASGKTSSGVSTIRGESKWTFANQQVLR